MKKFIAFLFVFLLTGCNRVNINDEITEIKYNNINIMEDSFNNIKQMIINNSSLKKGNSFKNKLVIKTKKDIYYISLNDDYIEYKGNIYKNNKLNMYLQNLTKSYTDKNFFDIKYLKDDNLDFDNKISLDKTSNYIVIKFNEKVTNFKINEIMFDESKDVDLLYSNDEAFDDVVIRKSINYHCPDIRISFTNKYNYEFSIIPKYENNEVKFITEIKNKD